MTPERKQALEDMPNIVENEKRKQALYWLDNVATQADGSEYREFIVDFIRKALTEPYVPEGYSLVETKILIELSDVVKENHKLINKLKEDLLEVSRRLNVS